MVLCVMSAFLANLQAREPSPGSTAPPCLVQCLVSIGSPERDKAQQASGLLRVWAQMLQAIDELHGRNQSPPSLPLFWSPFLVGPHWVDVLGMELEVGSSNASKGAQGKKKAPARSAFCFVGVPGRGKRVIRPLSLSNDSRSRAPMEHWILGGCQRNDTFDRLGGARVIQWHGWFLCSWGMLFFCGSPKIRCCGDGDETSGKKRGGSPVSIDVSLTR